MLTLMRQFFTRLRKRRRGEADGRPLIDREAIEEMLERSRVPAVLMLVLVWTVSSVLLILSRGHQYHLLDWVEGQRAAYSIYAAVDFEYDDSVATEQKRKEARESVPEYYRVDSSRVTGDAEAFFARLAVRVGDKSAKKEKTAAKPAEATDPAAHSAAVALADRLPSDLAADLCAAYRKSGKLFNYYLETLAKRGIVGAGIGDTTVRLVGKKGDFTANSFFTVDWCAGELTKLLMLNGTKEQHKAFAAVLKQLIGEQGDLVPDAEFTAAERKKAAAAVKKVKKSKSRGSLLIRKGEIYTSAKREMIDAERAATPRSGWFEAYRQMAWSFVILLAGAFSICMISREVFRDNVRLLLAGLTVSVALSLNYNAIRLVEAMLRGAVLIDDKLIVAALPVAFCAVVLTVVLDWRTAICAGGFVAVISAMMVTPSRSLELALRWTAVSSVVALFMRNVTNYRSFFVRALLGVLIVTWALSLDLIFYARTPAEIPRALGEAAWLIAGNAVVCAMLALLMIFVLELLFNLSTDMALIVLGQSNHPLLERMTREAGGTMSHATSVAVIAEDAARAIGANPLRAKVGALFHDIGKLTDPKYFTENNPESSRLHDRLTPEESSRIIRAHVTDGIELARQHRLCRFIRSVISSHHGDDLVRSFYAKAQEASKKTGVPVREEDFRYHGRPPRNKEEGIISLADACEAASRSLKDPTPEKIAAMVHGIFQGRFTGGMLRDCRLTADELDKLQKSFIVTLTCMMRGRIAYPEAAASADGDKK